MHEGGVPLFTNCREHWFSEIKLRVTHILGTPPPTGTNPFIDLPHGLALTPIGG